MDRDKIHVEQILDAVRKIQVFTYDMNSEQFYVDEKTQSAVIMQLALIGELAKKLSDEYKSKIDLPWKAIAGFRDMAIHDYYSLDIVLIWNTIQNKLSEMLEKIDGNTAITD